ncbi:MAG TPA: DegT/DnrJ/EryC1/StrS family aminotransferase [Rhizomicrobium sp.]|jgi:dTDP-4-amino-4,6-dideoxygalactose transaminase
MTDILTSDPAILGGKPICRGPYPSWPVWNDAERTRLVETLESGHWWDGDGRRAMGFARDFAAFQNAAYGLPMSNGTQTLEAALIACEIGLGDEVIVPAMTFIASASAVMAVNAVPILVDIDPNTLCIDVAAAEAAITDRTRAIIAVHVAGAAADLDALTELCSRRKLHLIEDCAHAHGTVWRGRGAGSWGTFGSFSMQASKLMTAGEGGVLICNDARLKDLAWSYANCGRETGAWFYHHPRYGSNLRMTEWQGAVLSAQLERFPEQNRTRNSNALALGEALGKIEGTRPQRRDPRMNSQGNYCYVFHYDSSAFAGLGLRMFERALNAEGVPMSVSYPSLNELEIFRSQNFGRRFAGSSPAIDYRSLNLPRAQHAAASTVWLQHRLLLGEREAVLDVAFAIARIQKHAKRIGATVNA